MAVKFKNTININDQYTFPSVVGTDGQYLSITDAAAGTLDWTNLGDIDGSKSNFVYYDAKNSTGSTIPVGTAVMAVGTDGNSGHILIAPMVADGSVEPKYFIGVTDTAIANGVIGKVVHFGLIDQVNTNAFSDGDVLWCDPNNPGGFTTTEPNAPAVKLASAIVINSSTNGKLLVRVQGNEGLHELHDVNITSVSDNQVLTYDAANGYWKNSPAQTGDGSFSVDTDIFTGNNSTTDFTLSYPVASENNVQVYIDGVYQSKDNYTTSGTTLSFSTPPPLGVSIEAVHIIAIDISPMATNEFVGNGVATTFTLNQSVSSENRSMVFIEGVYQEKSTYSISGTDIVFTTAPQDGYSIEVMTLGSVISGGNYLDADGTTNYVSKFAPNQTLVDSVIYDNGTNVGIGTSNPTNYLTLGFGGTDTAPAIAIGQDSDTGWFRPADNSIGFTSAGTERMRIDSSGNIGIGTASPATTLHVAGNTRIDGIVTPLTIRTLPGNTNYNLITRNSTGNALFVQNAQSNASQPIAVFQYGSDAVNAGINVLSVAKDATYFSSTNVGIGTSNPDTPLHVIGSSSAANFQRVSAGTINTLYTPTGTNTQWSVGAHSDGYFRITNEGIAERMRIDSSGQSIFYGDVTVENSSPTITLKSTDNTAVAEDIVSSIDFYAGDVSSAGTAVNAKILSYATDPFGRLGLQFLTGGSGAPTEAMRIGSNGRVGIGLTDPTVKLETLTSSAVRSAANSTHKLRFEARDDYYNDTSTAGFWISDGGITGPFAGAGAHLVIEGRKSAIRHIYFKVGDTTSPQHIMQADGKVGIGTSSPAAKLSIKEGAVQLDIGSGSNFSYLESIDRSDVNLSSDLRYYARKNGNHVWYNQAYTERMRINSVGNIGINTSIPSTSLSVNGVISVRSSDIGTFQMGEIGGTFRFQNQAANPLPLTFWVGDSERMRLETDGDLHVDGDVIAYSTTISDQRLKDDVQTIDNALDKVSNLRGVSYTWNNGNRKGQKDLGLIAQEVEQVLPELVREKEMPLIDGGTYKTVDYEKIVGVLVEAVKELTDKVNKLEAK